MLPATRRLPRAQFTTHVTTGRRYHSPHLTISYTPTTTPAQAAVVVSKKVAKSAVARNRLRRRLYAALASSPVYQGTGVYVIMAKAGAATSSRLAIRTECLDLLASITKAR